MRGRARVLPTSCLLPRWLRLLRPEKSSVMEARYWVAGETHITNACYHRPCAYRCRGKVSCFFHIGLSLARGKRITHYPLSDKLLHALFTRLKGSTSSTLPPSGISWCLAARGGCIIACLCNSVRARYLFLFPTVFDVLSTYYRTQSWPDALKAGVSSGKGYVLPDGEKSVKNTSAWQCTRKLFYFLKVKELCKQE